MKMEMVVLFKAAGWEPPPQLGAAYKLQFKKNGKNDSVKNVQKNLFSKTIFFQYPRSLNCNMGTGKPEMYTVKGSYSPLPLLPLFFLGCGTGYCPSVRPTMVTNKTCDVTQCTNVCCPPPLASFLAAIGPEWSGGLVVLMHRMCAE